MPKRCRTTGESLLLMQKRIPAVLESCSFLQAASARLRSAARCINNCRRAIDTFKYGLLFFVCVSVRPCGRIHLETTVYSCTPIACFSHTRRSAGKASCSSQFLLQTSNVCRVVGTPRRERRSALYLYIDLRAFSHICASAADFHPPPGVTAQTNCGCV